MSATIKTRTGAATLGDDGIVRFRCDPRAEIGSQDARDNVAACSRAAGGVPTPCIVDMRQLAVLDHAARAYHASKECGRHYTHVALLVASPLSRMIGSFLLGLNRPDYPLRMFSDEQRAVGWLIAGAV